VKSMKPAFGASSLASSPSEIAARVGIGAVGMGLGKEVDKTESDAIGSEATYGCHLCRYWRVLQTVSGFRSQLP
jgi:hypothetical protein